MRLCGVPSERGSLFPGGFPGLAPWAGMQCPLRAWRRKRGRRSGIGNTIGAQYRTRGRGPPHRKRGGRPGNGTAVGPRYRNCYRPICPEGATHTSPGHRPGNRIPEKRCVLKEHRIGMAGVDIRDTQVMRRSFRTRVSFSGWIPRVGTLGWYAMPLQGMVTDTRLGHGIANVLILRQHGIESNTKNRSEKRSVRRTPTRSRPFFLHRPGGSGVSDPSYNRSGYETTIQAAKPPQSLGTLAPACTLGLRATSIKTRIRMH